MNHIELANELAALKLEHKAMKAAAATVFRQYRAVEAKLLESMEAEKLKNFRLEDGTQLSIRTYFNASVTKGNQEQVREWLMETYGDDSDYVDEVVNKSAVEKLIKGEIDSKQKYIVEYPEFLNVKTSDGIVVRDLEEQS